MRGHDAIQNSWFSYVSLEDPIPKQHPLRRLRLLVDGVLASMDGVFAERYSHTGRPSIAPEKLLRALLLQVLYTIRSERQLMEQLDYNLLFRWFVGLGIDDAVWERTVFSAINELKARDIKAHVARKKTGSAVDGRTARGKGYAQSLKRRFFVEEAFGWIKTVGGLRKTRHIGLAKVAGQALFCFAAYNLTRLLNLLVFTPKAAWSSPT
ncbi:transposase [Methylomonas sp. 11b]|uniref:transposase n=1 Tax=Methylomonas sp. 11b TaxID=1168169 RepID=UPI00047E4050|nr:transposase [Methylomonas sp. 11b]